MKKNIIFTTLLIAAFSMSAGCKKDSAHPDSNTNFDLPSTPAPQGLEGNWSSGFASMLQLFDVYTGKLVGSAWTSGKVFKITADGKNAEFYYTVETQKAVWIFDG